MDTEQKKKIQHDSSSVLKKGCSLSADEEVLRKFVDKRKNGDIIFAKQGEKFAHVMVYADNPRNKNNIVHCMLPGLLYTNFGDLVRRKTLLEKSPVNRWSYASFRLKKTLQIAKR